MQYATRLNGDEAGRVAFAVEDPELTQEEADHVLPIMSAYSGILNSVRAEIQKAKDDKPDSEAIYGG